MKNLVIVGNQDTKVVVKDEPGEGGACHEYYICRQQEPQDEVSVPIGEFGHVFFQNGPIKEKGVNGCQQEDLLAIVIDRLRSFQKGAFACRENALALTKCEEALLWLQSRTNDRRQREVEGLNVL